MKRQLIAGVCAFAMMLTAGCGKIGLSATYIGSPKDGTMATTPPGWEIYDAEAVAGGTPTVAYLQGFGAGGNDPRLPMKGPRPGGILSIAFAPDLDTAARMAKNAFLADLDRALADGTATIAQERPVTEQGKWRYQTWILDVTVETGTVVRVIQTTATGVEPLQTADKSGTYHLVKSLVVGCDTACFAANQETIDNIVNSWDVY